MTLLALARMDANNSVTISRKGLSDLTGITDPSTLAKANREVQAIGLFEIDRGLQDEVRRAATVYRLTWWSQVFQRWLKAGYAVPETTTPTTQTPPTTRVLVIVEGFPYQRSLGKDPRRRHSTTSEVRRRRPR